MRHLLSALALASLAACANTVEMESGEIKALKLVKREMDATGRPTAYVDARKLVTRDMLDAAGIAFSHDLAIADDDDGAGAGAGAIGHFVEGGGNGHFKALGFFQAQLDLDV